MILARVAVCVAALLATCASCLAYDWPADVRLRPVFQFVEENDLVVDTDQHYTQGLKLSYLHTEEKNLGWLERLFDVIPAPRMDVQARRWGMSVGQNIYTPGDISATALLPNDRPYAGWLYVGGLLQRRGVTPGGLMAWDTLELDLGILGPGALAGDAQNWIHSIRGFGLAQGWGNQLVNEPAVELKASRFWVARMGGKDNGWALDCIPHTGIALGNVSTAAHLGATVRAGYHLPVDYGYQNVDSLAIPAGGLSGGETLKDWGFHVFAGTDGRAVAYSSLLDGNLFHSSHHVRRRPLVLDVMGGVTLWWKRIEATYAVVMQTEEFLGQSDRNAFGTFSLKWRF